MYVESNYIPDEDEVASDILQYANVTIYPLSDCREILPTAGRSNICIYDPIDWSSVSCHVSN